MHWGQFMQVFRGLLAILIAVYLAPGQMFALLTNYSDRGWYYGFVIALMIVPTYVIITFAATLIAYLSSSTVVLKHVLFILMACFSAFILVYFTTCAFNSVKRFFASENSAIPAPKFKRLDLLKTRGGTDTTEVDEPGFRTMLVANLTCITNPYVVGILLFSLLDSIVQVGKPGMYAAVTNVSHNGHLLTPTQVQSIHITSNMWTVGIFISIMLCLMLALYSVIFIVYGAYGIVLSLFRHLLGQTFYLVVLLITIFFLGLLFFTMLCKIMIGPSYSNMLAANNLKAYGLTKWLGFQKAGILCQGFFPLQWVF